MNLILKQDPSNTKYSKHLQPNHTLYMYIHRPGTFISSTESTATPAIPTSPTARGLSESYPL